MNALRVVHPPRPAKPTPPALAQQIDDLFELRALIRQAQAADRALTAEILAAISETTTSPVLRVEALEARS